MKRDSGLASGRQGLVSILVTLLAACPGYCVDRFVSTTGNDTTGNGTIGNPYKTIGKALTVVATGDTIYVRAGTYSYTGSSTAITLPTMTGASDTNRTKLMGYNGERPLIDFSAMTGTSADGLKINGSYWYIYGIDFKGAPHNGIKISGGNYNIVEYCTSYQNRNTGMQLGTAASNNRFINCDSYRNYDPQNSGGDADGFSPKMDVGTGNYFYGCRSWQNSDDGFDGYLRGADDVSTTYENCWTFENGWYWADGSTNTAMNGNGFKMGGSDNKDLRHNFTLKNCLAFGNKAKGFDQNSNLGSMNLYNCTAWNNGGNNYYISLALASGKTATVTNSLYLTGTYSLASFVVQTTNGWQSPRSTTAADFVSTDPAPAYGPRKADGSLPDITFMHLAAGSDMIDNGTDVGLPYTGTKPDIGAWEYVDYSDVTAPTPNPMTFAVAPYAADASTVTMVASTASDASGVQYYFHCTAGGGHDSAWLDSTSYTDSGLTANTTYSYQVKARDKSSNHNETDYSAALSATTPVLVDLTAPIPNPMTWAAAPSAIGTDTITMTATTATDISGVQYFFANITDANHNSGWQDSASYTDIGLTNNTTYAYRVIARDMSSANNETGWSGEASATTIRYTCGQTIAVDLNGDCRVDFMDFAEAAIAWGTTASPSNIVINGTFDTNLTSWTNVSISSATGTMTAALDAANGNPAGSALVTGVNGTTGANNHRFYQVFAVTQGKQYTVAGQWSGNIVGLVTSGTGGTLRNWAEVFVSFEASTTPTNWTATSALVYKKAYGAGTTNTSTGIWSWEQFSSSPNGSVPPAGGVFTATGPYMVVSFNVGGRANSGNPYINVDNISVVETAPCATVDLNADCVLDWKDMMLFTGDWLTCGRNPVSECWQ